MEYLGSVIGLGINTDGRPYAVYAFSGQENQREVAIFSQGVHGVEIGKGNVAMRTVSDEMHRVCHPSVRRPTVYAALITGGRELPFSQFGRSIDKDYCASIINALSREGGARRDQLRTPRIAGMINMDGLASLGIATEHGYLAKFLDPQQMRGDTPYVSEYSKEGSVSDLQIPTSIWPDIKLNGEKTSQKLADSMFDAMKKDSVFCTAASLWNPGNKEWDLAVRNGQ